MKINHDAIMMTDAFNTTDECLNEYLRTIEEPQQLINDFYESHREAMVAIGLALNCTYNFQSFSEKSMAILYGLSKTYRTPSRVVCVLQDDRSYADVVKEIAEKTIDNMGGQNK